MQQAQKWEKPGEKREKPQSFFRNGSLVLLKKSPRMGKIPSGRRGVGNFTYLFLPKALP
jgi:hypothetical protein